MENKTVGVIGLGIMGSAITSNLLAAGFNVFGRDVLAEPIENLTSQGGIGVSSAREILEKTSTIITSLPSVEALEEVVWGKHGLLTATNSSAVIAECSTLPIESKIRARKALKKVGMDMLDSPLSGTGAQAIHKDLAVYASGKRNNIDQCREVFDGFARSVHNVGDFGNGSKMKFVANLLVSIHNASAAEAFVVGMKAGLSPEDIYEVISSGAGTSRMFEVRGPMMVENNYDDATMKIEVWQKDLSIISDFIRELDCPVPLFSTSVQLYAAAAAQGRGDQDTGAVCAIFEELARLKRP